MLGNDIKEKIKRLLLKTESVLLGPSLVRVYATKDQFSAGWDLVSGAAALSLLIERGDTTRLLLRGYDVGGDSPELCLNVEAYHSMKLSPITKTFYVTEAQSCLLGLDFASDLQVRL